MARTLSSATTPVQSGSGSDGNEGILCIRQSSMITGTSPSDYLVSYTGHLLVVVGVLTLCREVADWAIHRLKCKKSFIWNKAV